MTPPEKTKEELLIEIAELVRSVDDLKNKLPERNKIFSEATTEAIFIHEAGKILSANEAFYKMVGYSSEKEIIGLTIFDLISEKDIAKAKEQLQTKSESPFLVEGKRKNGTTFTAEVTAKTVSYLNKQARVVLVRDVTVKEEYHQLIVESEDRFKKLISNIPAGLIIHFTNEIVFVNEYGFEILGAKGAKLEDFDAPSIYDFILPDYHDAVKERIERLNAGEDIPFLTVECNTLDNRVIFLETKSSIVRFGEKTAIQTVFFDSTERIKTQELLTENEEKLKQILTNIEDLIYYVDMMPDNTKVVKYISPQINKVLGVSQAEYTEKGHVLSERCHPDDLPRVIEEAIRLKKEKTPQRFTYRFKHGTSGKYIWIEERVFPRIEDGVHVGNFGITRDVTERVNYESEINHTKEQLSVVLNNIEEIVYFLNFNIPQEKTQVVFVNDKIETILGVTKDEFKDSVSRKNLIQNVHPDDVPSIKAVSEKLLKEKRAQRYQYRYRHHKTQKYIWVEEWVYPQYEDGKHVGNFGVTRDISELIKQEEKLRSSEEQFRMLAENALDIVYRYSLYPEPKYEYVSRSAEYITGYKVEEFYANPLLGFDLIHPNDKHLVQSSREIIEKKHQTSGTTPKSLQIRWIKKDGTIIWTETLNKIITDETGRVIAVEGISRDITERKAAEEELKRSEQKFILLSNSAPIGIFLSDARGVPYYANKKLEEITGLSLDNIINTSWFKHIHPHDAKTVAARVRESIINEKDFSEEFRVRNLMGARWIKFQSTTVWSAEKKLIGWVGTIEDISKRKEDEEKIAANELRYRQLFENNMAGVYRVSLDGKILECNQALADIFEYTSPYELKNINSINLYFDLADREAYIDRLNSEKRLVNHQLRLKTKNNKEIIVLVNAALTLDTTTGLYCNEGTLVEITSSVKSEKALKESERALSTLMNSLPGMAYRCLYDESWTMLFVSSGCFDLTGYKSAELLHNDQKTYSDIVHPEDKMVGRDQIAQSLKTAKPFEIEYRIINKSGETKWVWEKGEPVFDENKNLLFLEGFITDVTDRKEYEERIKQNNENYKSVFENMPDGILIHNFDNVIQFINPAALNILGIGSIKELKSHLVQDNIHPTKLAMALERRRLVAEGHQVPFVRTIVLRNNGKEQTEVESRISLIDFEGKKSFLVIWRDTSTERELEREQIRAEEAELNNKKLQQEIAERKNAERILSETQKYTRLLIDSSIDMICATDKEGFLTEFNPAAQKVFGYKASEVMGKHVNMLYLNPEDRKAITNNKLYKDGTFAGEVINKKKDGTTFPAFLSASVLKDESGSIIGAMGVSRDITEIKKAEQNIKASEERYRAIYNQAYIAIAQIDRDGKFLQVNDQLSKIIGYTSKGLLLKNITDITHPEDRNKKGTKNKAFIVGEKENTTIEKRYIHSSGAIVFASVTMSIVRDEKNKPDYAIVVIQDITEKKKAEQQIKAQAAKLNAIIESSSHHIWTINEKMCLTSFNRNYSELMHRRYNKWVKIADNIMDSPEYISNAEYNNYWQKKYKEAFAGKSQQFETSFIESNGTASWLEVYLNPIIGADGSIKEVSGIGHDITEKKISEEQIRQSLKEKEVLLKEVHHRVKNNIQVISSILNLQSSYVKDANTINMLKECQNRIKSMAFIHESLYQTKDFSKINFQEYLTKLAHNLVYSYEMQNSNIKLKTEVDNIMLNLDQSIPCGLIVNELISNALKYAFKGRKKGEINVVVKQDKDDYISISVADNGVGLPDKFDYKNTDSLGLQLVVTLTEQLSGNIKLFRKKGTKFTIAFKHQPVKSRI